MNSKKEKLSTDSYKGVRDFYPEEMFIQKYLYGVWRKVAESYGYEEYDASILEPSELYRAKTNEEIVNEQTYTFTDRGGREVTLRPEMTPSVARMVAAKRPLLTFPLRWYSISNFFRYEKPQRGRLREHWQLNVDMFGTPDTSAELEVIALASDIMKSFGAKKSDFEVRINSRKIMNYILAVVFELNDKDVLAMSRLIDRKDKTEEGIFMKKVEAIMGERATPLLHVLDSNDLNVVISNLKISDEEKSGLTEIKSVMSALNARGIDNLVFSPTLIRGFDYYTGVVFEIYDTNPENKRSLFGGGRYDNLLSLFGDDQVPALGFAMGDVTVRDFLETRGLLPEYSPALDIAVLVLGEENNEKAETFAQALRVIGMNAVVDASSKKIGDKIKIADKRRTPYITVFGEEEVKSGKYKVKNLKTGTEKTVEIDGIKAEIK